VGLSALWTHRPKNPSEIGQSPSWDDEIAALVRRELIYSRRCTGEQSSKAVLALRNIQSPYTLLYRPAAWPLRNNVDGACEAHRWRARYGAAIYRARSLNQRVSKLNERLHCLRACAQMSLAPRESRSRGSREDRVGGGWVGGDRGGESLRDSRDTDFMYAGNRTDRGN
jgi:hypothetical protein